MDTLTTAYSLAKEIGFSFFVDEDRSKRPTFVVINSMTGKVNNFCCKEEAVGYLRSMTRFIKEQH